MALDDRYELTEQIGSGGMAEVWRARDHRLERDVAVKLLPQAVAGDESKRRRIEREARALAALSHPNIVAVYDYGETSGPGDDVRPYIVMELVDGPDLHAYLEEHTCMSPLHAQKVMGEVLSALEVAHAAGIVHGDLKPANILLGAGGAKIGDFGVARILDEETGNTTVAATPSYAAPEVLRGERAGPPSDIYSASCLAFHLLTGRPPYAGSNAWEIANKHLEEAPPRLRDVLPALPAELDEAVRRGMEKNPRRRHRSAADFARSLAVEASVTIPVAGARAEPTTGPNDTEAIGVRADLGRVALLGPLAPLWDRLSRSVAWGRVLAVGVVAFLVAFGIIALRGGGTPTVSLPDVTGVLVTDAVADLRVEGLVVSDVSFRPVESEPGRVLETIPAAGVYVEEGSEVHLVVGALAQTPEPLPTPAVDDDDDDDDDDNNRGGGRGQGGRGGPGE